MTKNLKIQDTGLLTSKPTFDKSAGKTKIIRTTLNVTLKENRVNFQTVFIALKYVSYFLQGIPFGDE